MDRIFRSGSLVGVVFIFGCGGSPPRHTDSHEPLSAQEHATQAGEHDQAAAAAAKHYRPPESGNAPIDCIDQPLAPDPTSGGERIPIIKPCWVSDRGNSEYLAVAERQHKAAVDHRKRAHELVAAEHEACQGLGQDEISHSPFYHRADIDHMVEIRSGKVLKGAKVYFRKVSGLTEAWMAKAVACHQARAAAMGYDTKFMSYCPLMLEGIAASVEEDGDFIVVGLRSDRDEMAAAAVGRLHDAVKRDK